ncbi:DUF4407 domain-containing protein [Carboxylicivirga sp. RSCT41]|uniref:DUF4407 domain-containing protein n=1 Tax=Carboxylicivirga agarovorans TaxID=3417570 RepID=UPI003D344AF4
MSESKEKVINNKEQFTVLQKLFFWTSGVNLDILRKVPLEKNKFFGIGGTIFFTAMMAAMAGGYACYTVFQSYLLAMVFGVFWGALILNLDRYIVCTIHFFDKVNARTLFSRVMPRLVMAVFLGIIIAVPLELKLFEREINLTLQEDRLAKLAQQEGNVDALFSEERKRLLTELDTIKQQEIERRRNIKALQHQVNIAYKIYMQELDGSGGSGKKGSGPIYKEKKKEYERLEQQLLNYEQENRSEAVRQQKRVSVLEDRLSANKKMKEQRLAQFKVSIASNNGLAARIMALSRLSEENSSVMIAKWLISLLFIFIEVAPMLFKMITPKGPYEYMLHRKQTEVVLDEKWELKQIELVYHNKEKLYEAKMKNELQEALKAVKVEKNKDTDNRESDPEASNAQLSVEEKDKINQKVLV